MTPNSLPRPHTRLLRRLASCFQPSENATLVGLAVSVGLAAGAGVWLFRLGIDLFHRLFHVESLHPLLGRFAVVPTLALAGLIVGWIIERFIGEERHHGVAGIMEAVARAGGRLRYRRFLFKALASAVSLGAGASVGPEDPSVQIGANIGSMFGQKLRLSEERVRLLVAAGAASAVAAAFQAPIAGVFFALEVILGEFTSGAFGVVVLAAVLASVFVRAIGGALPLEEPALNLLNYSLGSVGEMPLHLLLGLLLGPVAALFIRSVYAQHDWWHQRVRWPRPLRTALAGAIVGAVGAFLPDALGPGREAMNHVLSQPTAFTVALLLALGFGKLILTGISIAGGFVGGVFAPTLFIGLMLGSVFGRVLEALRLPAVSDPQAFAIVGMAAMMAGVVRAPITAIMLVFELTNDYRLILPIMLAAIACMFVAERFVRHGIYALGLARKGVYLSQGRDVDVMQGVTVGEAMTAPAPTINEDASLLMLRDTLRQCHTRALCVVDDRRRLSGIVTLTDLQRVYEQRPTSSEALTVGDICTRDVITASPDDVLWTAVRTMGARDIGRLPVVRPGTRELLGMLSRSDIVQAYNTAIARKLHDQHRAEQVRLNALTGAHVFELRVAPGAPAAGRSIREVHWPAESVIASVQRGGKLIVPHGVTDLQPGDLVTVVAALGCENELERLFGQRPRAV
ncbi:MAG: chloride channel protein [Aggregatilineales bacterium]